MQSGKISQSTKVAGGKKADIAMAISIGLIPLLMGWVFTEIDVIKTTIKFKATVIGYGGGLTAQRVLLYSLLKILGKSVTG